MKRNRFRKQLAVNSREETFEVEAYLNRSQFWRFLESGEGEE